MKKTFPYFLVFLLVLFAFQTNGLAAITALHEFAGGADDGRDPHGSLIPLDGALYGMSYGGGDNDLGVIFKINTDGSGFALLHEFTGAVDDGAYPWDSLTTDGSALYGMASSGGAGGRGVIFKIETDGSGFTLLHSFTGGASNGLDPWGSLTCDGSALYGMASLGGASDRGVIFRINTDGSGFTLLHSFAGGADDGNNPAGSLALGGSVLYGFTRYGGDNNLGVIFRINTDGSGYQVLREFAGGADDGAAPVSGALTLGGSVLYGCAQAGGDSGLGVVFRINTDGSGFALLHEFAGGTDDGSLCMYAQMLLKDGVLYGMAYRGGGTNLGVVFKVNTDGSGYGLLHHFLNGEGDGALPFGPLTYTDSTAYGCASAGGAPGEGIIFSLDYVFPAAPSVTTTAAGAIDATGAILNGAVNANNADTTVTFEYGLDTAYGNTVTADQSPVTGTADTPVYKAIVGLTPNTTYHFRAVGQNFVGGANGADMTFTTPAVPPSVTTTAAGAINPTGAMLNGAVNANNADTTVTFEYGFDTGYGTTVTADQSPVTGTGDTPVSKTITGLIPNTTYHFRVVGQNVAGTANGSDMTFTAPAVPPSVTTLAVSDITGASALGHGLITDLGAPAITQHGLCWNTVGNPTIVDNRTQEGAPDATGPFTSSMDGLALVTTYYVRAYATSAAGTVYGDEERFVTLDGNGVDPAIQDAAPNNGDGNGDGVLDSAQPSVASLPSDANPHTYLTIEAFSECGHLEKVRAYTSMPRNDPAYIFPFGMVGFESPCSPVTIRVYYHGVDDITGLTYRKFGPGPSDWNTSIWYSFPVTHRIAQIGGTAVPYVEFTLNEGLLGDGTNGLPIVDPGGLALALSTIHAIPTLGEWGLIMLKALLTLAGIMTIRHGTAKRKSQLRL